MSGTFKGSNPMLKLDQGAGLDEIQNLAQFFAMATMSDRRVDAISEWGHLWDVLRPKSEPKGYVPPVLDDRETYMSLESRFAGVLGVLPDICRTPKRIESVCTSIRGVAYGLVVEPDLKTSEVADGVYDTLNETRPRGASFYQALASLTFPRPHTFGAEEDNQITVEHLVDLDIMWPRSEYLAIARELPPRRGELE